MRSRRAGAQQLSGSHLPGRRRRGARSFLEPCTKPFECSRLQQGKGLHGRQEHPVPLKTKGRRAQRYTHIVTTNPAAWWLSTLLVPHGDRPERREHCHKTPSTRAAKPQGLQFCSLGSPWLSPQAVLSGIRHRNQPSPRDGGCLLLQPVLRWQQAGTSTLQDAQTRHGPGSPTPRGHPVSQASAPRGPSSSSPASRDEETPLQQPGRALPWQPLPLQAARDEPGPAPGRAHAAGWRWHRRADFGRLPTH